MKKTLLALFLVQSLSWSLEAGSEEMVSEQNRILKVLNEAASDLNAFLKRYTAVKNTGDLMQVQAELGSHLQKRKGIEKLYEDYSAQYLSRQESLAAPAHPQERAGNEQMAAQISANHKVLEKKKKQVMAAFSEMERMYREIQAARKSPASKKALLGKVRKKAQNLQNAFETRLLHVQDSFAASRTFFEGAGQRPGSGPGPGQTASALSSSRLATSGLKGSEMDVRREAMSRTATVKPIERVSSQAPSSRLRKGAGLMAEAAGAVYQNAKGLGSRAVETAKDILTARRWEKAEQKRKEVDDRLARRDAAEQRVKQRDVSAQRARQSPKTVVLYSTMKGGGLGPFSSFEELGRRRYEKEPNVEFRRMDTAQDIQAAIDAGATKLVLMGHANPAAIALGDDNHPLRAQETYGLRKLRTHPLQEVELVGCNTAGYSKTTRMAGAVPGLRHVVKWFVGASPPSLGDQFARGPTLAESFTGSLGVPVKAYKEYFATFVGAELSHSPVTVEPPEPDIDKGGI